MKVSATTGNLATFNANMLFRFGYCTLQMQQPCLYEDPTSVIRRRA
ncbi:hypothetical protein SAMN04488078_102067 [Antarctobacter heliothermus]|uniref:Uncharacterized protein n=1 Tax=Antarctobacter heliothermus TaxID=74033 RepID=A0A239FJN2_9RHOB|nr:hypothetical protein SAMN04488078_102067 [Antarctobacter heliothermus]